MNRLYTIKDHTADIRMRLEAPTLEELFIAGLQGMAELIAGDISSSINSYDISCTISGKAPDTTILLIDFLSEVLTQTHLNSAVFYSVTFAEINDFSFSAVISGKYIKQFKEDIKAVTYHEAEVVQNDNGMYTTFIVFDI